MAIDQLPSGAWRARLQLDGRRFSATLRSEEEARQWEILTRGKHITGSLPTRLTVAEYAARWIQGYETAPTNTRR